MNVCVRPQDSAQVLDEGLFRALHTAPSSLTPIADLLRWTEDEGGRQSGLLQVKTTSEALGFGSAASPSSLLLKWRRLFQTLSSELDALSAELTCQRSKVGGLSGVQQCLDDVFRVLSVIRASLAFREKQLGDLEQKNVQVRTRYHGYKMIDY